MQDRVLIKNAQIYRNHKFESGSVLVKEGRISALGPGLELSLIHISEPTRL